MRNAGRFLKEAGVDAVKLEGGVRVALPRQGDPRRRHRRLRPHRAHAAELRAARRAQGAGPHARDAPSWWSQDARALARRASSCCWSRPCRPRSPPSSRAELPIPVLGIGAGSARRRPAAHRQRRARHLPGVHPQVREEVRRPRRASRRPRSPSTSPTCAPAPSPRSSTATACWTARRRGSRLGGTRELSAEAGDVLTACCSLKTSLRPVAGFTPADARDAARHRDGVRRLGRGGRAGRTGADHLPVPPRRPQHPDGGAHRRGDDAGPSATARRRTAPTPASPRCVRRWPPTSAPPAASPTQPTTCPCSRAASR